MANVVHTIPDTLSLLVVLSSIVVRTIAQHLQNIRRTWPLPFTTKGSHSSKDSSSAGSCSTRSVSSLYLNDPKQYCSDFRAAFSTDGMFLLDSGGYSCYSVLRVTSDQFCMEGNFSVVTKLLTEQH